MGRKCGYPGCSNNVGLYSLPANKEIAQRWLEASGRLDVSLGAPSFFVCKLHFARECFSNFVEVELGFCKQLRLNADAVPITTTIKMEQSPYLAFRSVGCQAEATKTTHEIGCQTEQTWLQHDAAQVHVEPVRTSKVESCTPVKQEVCEELSQVPVKRPRCDDSDSTFHPDVTERTIKCESSSHETPPHKMKKYFVYEDNLMELFRKCPLCTRSCKINSGALGSLLQVHQECPNCSYTYNWSSQPFVDNIPAGNLHIAAAVLLTGSSFSKISDFMNELNAQWIEEMAFHKHQENPLFPMINRLWDPDRNKVHRDTKNTGSVTFSGDMPAVAPGHNEEYENYTKMDVKDKKVIKLVQSVCFPQQEDKPVNLWSQDGQVAHVAVERQMEGHSVQGNPILASVHPVHEGEEKDTAREETQKHRDPVDPVESAAIETQLGIKCKEEETEEEIGACQQVGGQSGIVQQPASLFLLQLWNPPKAT